MGYEEFIKRAKYAIAHVKGVSPTCVTVVWSCKCLQNFKGIFITFPLDGYLFEVSYDGNKKQMYIDMYKKESNTVFNSSGEIRTESR